MATFHVFLRNSEGRTGKAVVEGRSFADALKAARELFPRVTFTRVWIVDDPATLTLLCPKCRFESDLQVEWGARTEAVIACDGCGTSLRLGREHTVIARPASTGRAPPRPQVLGQPPHYTSEHTRQPTKTDRLRAMIAKPAVVTWNCRACKWSIDCDWAERNAVQDCPECGCKQYVPSSAFEWNARIMSEREGKQRAVGAALLVLLLANRQASEAEARRAREAAEVAQREQEKQNRLILNQLSEVAVGAGLVESKEAFLRLDETHVRGIKLLSDYADALRDDLMAAMDDNVAAEQAVAYGRPAAAGVGLLSAAGGYGWAGLAFGALAVSARWLSDDWKRAQMAEYQAKWVRLLSQFSAGQMRSFTAVFAFKYPALASIAAGMQGRLPS